MTPLHSQIDAVGYFEMPLWVVDVQKTWSRLIPNYQPLILHFIDNAFGVLPD